MCTRRIKNRKIKDILEVELGKENAVDFLTIIQNEYNKGVRGEAFRELAQTTLKKYSNVSAESAKIIFAVIAITVG